MRLIDADAVMEMLTNIELSCTAIPMIEAKTRLREIPTAYDVDRVVGQIKEARDKECASAVPKIRMCDAIEIVKAGGVNET